MQIRCPHCQAPFESRDEQSWTDIICPSCDNSFSLTGAVSTCAYRAGVKVLGRFELLHEVGSGRFGSVWKARDSQLQRTVAVKIPRQRELNDHETELFLRDARAAAQLNHSGIASVHEVGREDDILYIVTDFIDGANLNEWLSGKRLNTLEAAALVRKIAEALHHAHEAGVIHRDVKPGNIMLDRNGEPYVIDFGLARREVGEVTMTVDGQILGTPAYMSPEQALGEGHRADRRSDIYSLGVVLFKLLTGELPFRGEFRMLLLQIINDEPPSPRALNATVPRDLETIALKCMEKEPAKRYQTARDLAEDLTHYLTGEPINARPVGRIERAWRWCKRHPELASVSGLLLLLLTAVSIIAPIIAIHEAGLRRESELQVAKLLFQRAGEEYSGGRILPGVALLSAAYDKAGADTVLIGSIRNLMAGWSSEGGRPMVQDETVLAVAMSHDGKTALVGGHDLKATARLWDIETNKPIGSPLQHASSVRALAFSPTPDVALTASQDKTARLWHVKAATPFGEPMRHADGIWAAAFSPDGKMVATGGRDNTARLWDARTGKSLGEPLQHSDKVLAVAFNPDSRILMTGSFDRVARFWDVESKQPLGGPITFKTPVYAVAFSPDGSRFLTCCADKTAQLWNTESRTPFGKPMLHDQSVYTATFSHDGRTLLTGGFDNTARLWDSQTQEPIGSPMRHDGWVMSIAISSDDDWAMTGSADRTAHLWHLRQSRVLNPEGAAAVAAFSPDGRNVVTGGDTTTRLWDAQSSKLLRDLPQHASAVTAATFSPDGLTALIGYADHHVQLWAAHTGKSAAEKWKFSGVPRQIDFSADGKSVLIRSSNETGDVVQLLDYPSGGAVSDQLRLDSSKFKTFVFASSPDRHTLLIKDSAQTARLWDVPTGKYRSESLQHNSEIWAACFSANGRKLLTGAQDQYLRIWDARTGKAMATPIRTGGIVKAVAISADDKIILTGSSDQMARLWDADTGAALGQPMKHASEISSVALSLDSHLALSISKDGSAHLWDVRSSKLMARPLQYEIKVTEGAFNADGSIILFKCADGTPRLYDIPRPVPNNSKMIHAWARARSGYHLDEQGIPQQLSQAEWLDAQDELDGLVKRP